MHRRQAAIAHDREQPRRELRALVEPGESPPGRQQRVLRQVDLVSMRTEGQQHLYKIKADTLRPIHDWVKPFEQLWNERFDRLAAYLNELQAKEKSNEQTN